MVPKVQCPVCSLSVPEKFLNIHLDKCLESSEKGNVKNQKRIAAASQKTLTKDAKKTARKEKIILSGKKQEKESMDAAGVQRRPEMRARRQMKGE